MCVRACMRACVRACVRVCVCVYGIQNKKQTSLNISMFIFIFQIKSWPKKYNEIGSHDLCAPIPLTIKLKKTTKDRRCRTLQFNLRPGCPITPFSLKVSQRSLGTGPVMKPFEALTISVLKRSTSMQIIFFFSSNILLDRSN